MISPDPALAGPRHPAASRADARGTSEPADDARRTDLRDFGAVLTERAGRRARPEAEASAPADVALTAAGGAAPVPVPLPAAPIAPEAAPTVAAPSVATPQAVVAAPAAVAGVPPTKSAPAEAGATVLPEVSSVPAIAADPAGRAAAPEVASATTAQAPRPAPPINAVRSDAASAVPPQNPRAPARRQVEEPSAERDAPPRTPASAPPVLRATAPDAGSVAAPASDASRHLTVRDLAPPAWHLVAAAPPAHGGAEPAPVVQAAAAPQAVIGQIAVAVAKTEDRRVEIRLDPPELGRVQIHLNPVEGGVQAVVLADRPETQDLLRRHAEILARELGSAGFGSVSLDFSAGGQAAPERDAPTPAPAGWEQANLAPSPSAEPSTATIARRAAVGLDIRL